MRVRMTSFIAICVLAFALALSLELTNDQFWHGAYVGTTAAVSWLALLLIATVLRVPSAARFAGSTACALAVAAIWLLPISPIERFVRDVRRIQQGMSPQEVDQVLREHVKGAKLAGCDGRSIIPPQPIEGATYYEPRRQHHSFDTCALVSWENERVACVDLRID